MNVGRIKLDRMWTEGKKHRTDIDEVLAKVNDKKRLSDTDMVVIKYALLMADLELKGRYIDDLEEEKKLRDFSS
jgi:hypothetical protein